MFIYYSDDLLDNVSALLYLQTVLNSIGVSIWQMAVAPSNNHALATNPMLEHIENGYLSDRLGMDDNETSEVEDDSDSVELYEQPVIEFPRVAIACNDGCVRIYSISDSDELIYNKSLPRVSGEISFAHHICSTSP